MSTPEESPAQRAARLRRERREAKIKEGGSARLDKITSLSGRNPQSVREEEASPSPQLAVSPSPSPVPQTRPAPAPQPEMPSAESLQAQQEAFRAMLRQVAPEQGQQSNDVEDPTLKLLENLLGAMPGDGNAPPPAAPGTPGAMPGQSGPGLSPAAIASALGVPPFLANMLGGASQPPTEKEQKTVRMWEAFHGLFAVGVAIYLLFIIGTSVATFGSPPPKPATAQNPFLIFVTGEMVLTGGRVLFGGKQAGLGMVVQLLRDIVRDGSLVIFALGLGAWYNREWQAVGY
ncbi:uncharacterized protein N7473_002538 [Penicillium subrubescens]|uniref:GET complex, subunit GET2 n=1 Tax=Penicillium subrubescens TaxID=1316194 RepID=A0A1Q5UNY6_9EURO|nr:uncharacterized protein N7473_002538 [Penicillium subrubescens]KAJ5905622.1 hypothetical protein N7473_002538 [Penicillium subrubescens]OKP14176.1 hypothetical protein PENSUB_170 [Penicillium subrubescens]